MRVPGLAKRNHSILAGGGIAAQTKVARVEAIVGVDSPAPFSVTRGGCAWHAVEYASDLSAIKEHDKAVRRFVGGGGLERIALPTPLRSATLFNKALLVSLYRSRETRWPTVRCRSDAAAHTIC